MTLHDVEHRPLPARSGSSSGGRPDPLLAIPARGRRRGDRRTAPPALRFFCLALVAVLFTLAGVAYSVRHGRLLLFPTFDDAGYLLDGISRLQHFYYAGMQAIAVDIYHDPPHAPYSTYEAFVSFLIFGMHDWAPYAGNAALILVFLGLGDWLGRGLRTWHKACLAIILLSFPMLTYAVMTCRPDFAAAVLTTAGAWTLLAKPARGCLFVRGPTKRKLASGALFGLAMLAKPSVFPATLAIMGNCLLAAALCDWFDPVARRSWRARGTGPALLEMLRAWVLCALPMVLLAGPYYLVGGKSIFQYIWVNTYGADAVIWKSGLSRADRAQYYLWGAGGQTMLGNYWELLAAIFAAGLIFYLVRRERRELLRMAAFVWVAAVSFAICFTNPQIHMFLGLTFQTPLIFLALLVLRNLVLSQRFRRHLPWAEALLALAAAWAVWNFQWPTPVGNFGSATVRDKWAVVDGVFDAVRDRIDAAAPGADLGTPTAPHWQALVTVSGDMSSAVLNYFAVKNLTPVTFYDLGVARTPAPYLAEFDAVDFVIAADPGMDQGLVADQAGLVASYIPNAGFQDKLLAILRSRADYRLIARIEYPPNHRFFYVFQHSGAFDGLKPISGVGPLEGPYPQWKLPFHVRWGLMPRSRLRPDPALVGPSGGRFILALDFSSRMKNQSMTVSLDGREIGAYALTFDPAFRHVDLPVDLTPGPHEFTISYAQGQGPDPNFQMAVLFKAMKLVKAPEPTQPTTAPATAPATAP